MQEVAKMSLYMWQVGLWAGKGGERRKGDNNQMAKNLKAWRISGVEWPSYLGIQADQWMGNEWKSFLCPRHKRKAL
jgi:hypothetical protein